MSTAGARRVFISGVSDGIGRALAERYLADGWTVYGISGRCPDLPSSRGAFVHRHCDLGELDDASALFDGEFAPILRHGVSVAHLNAGSGGGVPRAARDSAFDALLRTMRVNALANTLLLGAAVRPGLVVVSASIAGRRFRAGMLPYCMSKAALAALSGVYAAEYPDVFFAVLGLCNVDSALSRDIVDSPRVAAFPDLAGLRERFRVPGYAVSPVRRAADVFDLLHPVRDARLVSGRFVEMRHLLAGTSDAFMEDCQA